MGIYHVWPKEHKLWPRAQGVFVESFWVLGDIGSIGFGVSGFGLYLGFGGLGFLGWEPGASGSLGYQA